MCCVKDQEQINQTMLISVSLELALTLHSNINKASNCHTESRTEVAIAAELAVIFPDPVPPCWGTFSQSPTGPPTSLSPFSDLG